MISHLVTIGGVLRLLALAWCAALRQCTHGAVVRVSDVGASYMPNILEYHAAVRLLADLIWHVHDHFSSRFCTEQVHFSLESVTPEWHALTRCASVFDTSIAFVVVGACLYRLYSSGWPLIRVACQ